jgi:tripartite-type tricarboxylate transporter receptor subunit TctC
MVIRMFNRGVMSRGGRHRAGTPTGSHWDAAVCRAAVVLVFILAAAGPARAQAEFPNRNIKIVVPFLPGGANDILARVVGQKISETLKVPVLVENRGGGAGAIGMDAVAKAPPDGYMVAVTSAGTLAIAIALKEKLPYDTFKNFKPVTLMTRVPEVLVTATSLPVNNLGDLVALARSKPGSLNFASSGAGSMSHLTSELLKMAAKIDLVHVPYKGGAPALNDLLAQQMQMAFFDLPTVLPLIEGGKLKALAVASPERASTLPNVPTTAELGFPQVQAENWYGMVAPIATPPEVIARLYKATIDAMRDPDVQQKLTSQGMILQGNSPDEFAAYIASEIEKWAKAGEEAGLIKN